MVFSFIFPIHNEEAFLNSQINIFINHLTKKYKNKFEIILVENGSSDQTWFIIKNLEKKYKFIKSYQLLSPSYGSAIKLGMINASGRKIFILNIDYFDFDFIEKANKLLNSVEIVIGSKTLANSFDERSFSRRITTYCFNVFLRLILNYPGTDTHGIKAFRNSARLISFVKICITKNELFDTELILRLTRNGAIFVDLPQKIIELRKSRYTGMRRIKSTFLDFISIIQTKYFSKKLLLFSFIDADDFGFSKKINQAIIDGVESKSINIVSIVPNLVKKSDINKLKNSSKILIYSMHFNLLRGRPCSQLKKVGSLVDFRGRFYSFPIFFIRLNLGLIKFIEIEREFLAQYRRLLKLGIKPTHVSSEQHVHILSPINTILEKSINKTSIKKIRSVASSIDSLDGKYLRKFCLIFFKHISELKFKKFHEFKNKYEACIIHPGAKKTIL